ncbi:hypothetical protein C3F09_06740 [candidate division GN15 bacterium]|uniref:DinB-like domain-containing protein n=1 Tax=candidate division GN15 bacterium TaxID=2072418 RepID=A0A855X0N9_9BACT|nr:MAG: hypothetical protein C3F09_06740 [candidate division GN15 bacterium]
MTITLKDILKDHVRTMHGIIRKVIDDITEEESMRTIGSSPNHIKWQTGHLVFAAMLAGGALGAEMHPPEGWDKLFGRGAEPPDKQKHFPPMAQLRAQLYDFQAQIVSQIESVAEDRLTTRRQISGTWEDTPLNAVLFLCGHDFYHCGQIAMIRHDLGRERSFG